MPANSDTGAESPASDDAGAKYTEVMAAPVSLTTADEEKVAALLDPSAAADADPVFGTQSHAEWVERLDVPTILGVVRDLVQVAQNLSGERPNAYAAALTVKSMGEFLTGYVRPRASRPSQVSGSTARALPGRVVEDALRPYTDNDKALHAAVDVMNALRQAGLKVVPAGE